MSEKKKKRTKRKTKKAKKCRSRKRAVQIKICFGQLILQDFDTFKAHCDFLHQAVLDGKIKAMHAVGQGGIAADVAQMAFGNGIGFAVDASFATQELFNLRYGSILVETDAATAAEWVKRARKYV